MKTKQVLILSLAALALTMPVLTSCSDSLSDDDHYKTPDWLKGNAYEVLQKEGNYSIFLEGLNLCGYGSNGITDGKSLVTVMAPDDDAFTAFLSEKGYSSIDEMYQKDATYTKDLIGMHLMYYAYDWNKMVNFRPLDGDLATDEEKAVNAGYYYKQRTHSQAATDYISQGDLTYETYHYERSLPVFSTKMFQSKAIDASKNYTYFYPNTTWYGDEHSGDGFNVAEAAVNNEENIITDNGYLYKVDRVIEPVYTIYEELQHDADYSKFLSIYDGYTTLELAPQDIRSSMKRDQLYIHEHGDLPPIALERPLYNGEVATSDKMDVLCKDGYNLFAPTNTALDNFFQQYWAKNKSQGYSSIENLDPLIKKYFIEQLFTKDNFIVFPEEIEKGTVETKSGTMVNIDPSAIAQNRRKICCNGVLYGMEEMTAPAIFSSVVGPAFQDTLYNCYLYCLDGSGQIAALSTEGEEFVSLIPDNFKFYNSTPAMRLEKSDNMNILESVGTDGQYTAMGDNAKTDIVQMHTTSSVSSLPESGEEVIPIYQSFNYWFVKGDDKKITTNAIFNKQLDETYNPETDVLWYDYAEKLTPDNTAWSTGRAYTYSAPSLFTAVSSKAEEGIMHKIATCSDNRYPYYYYTLLLKAAGMINSEKINYGADDSDELVQLRYVIFALTNDFVLNHLNEIPGCSAAKISQSSKGVVSITGVSDKSALAKFLRSLSFASDRNTFTEYPYYGSSCMGTFKNNENSAITLSTVNSTVAVSLGGSPITVDTQEYGNFPFIFGDACLYFISGIPLEQ